MEQCDRPPKTKRKFCLTNVFNLCSLGITRSEIPKYCNFRHCDLPKEINNVYIVLACVFESSLTTIHPTTENLNLFRRYLEDFPTILFSLITLFTWEKESFFRMVTITTTITITKVIGCKKVYQNMPNI